MHFQSPKDKTTIFLRANIQRQQAEKYPKDDEEGKALQKQKLWYGIRYRE